MITLSNGASFTNRKNGVEREMSENAPVHDTVTDVKDLSNVYEQIEESSLTLGKVQVEYKALKNSLENDFSIENKEGVIRQLAHVNKCCYTAYSLYTLACREREKFRLVYDRQIWIWNKEFKEGDGKSAMKSWASFETQFKQWLACEKKADYWQLENKKHRLKEYRGMLEQLWSSLRSREISLRNRLSSF